MRFNIIDTTNINGKTMRKTEKRYKTDITIERQREGQIKTERRTNKNREKDREKEGKRL